jgi:mannose-6-phosphate isomerase-like protein (cupin superfamily)
MNRIFRAKEFVGEKPWDSIPIAQMNKITTKLHWTDAPYKWHINTGEEVFAVLDGTVDMELPRFDIHTSYAAFNINSALLGLR